MRRPLLRWAGSKRMQLPEIKKLWPSAFERYLEPFCGSCAALAHVDSREAILNDINPELINFWREIKARPLDVHAGVAAEPKSPERYYELRSQDPASLASTARAIRFCYLNRYSFNGLYRTNKLGQYNVPYGGKRCGSVPPAETFQKQSDLLADANFDCGDFERFIHDYVKSGDFVYLDPPYAIKGSRVSGDYDPQSFRSSDLVRLVRCLEHIDKVGAKYLLSYAEDENLSSTLSSQLRGSYEVRRRISGFQHARSASQELAFTNYELS